MVLPRVNPHFKPLSPCLKRRNTHGENDNKDRKSVRWSGSLEEIHYIPPREKKSSKKSREQVRNDRDMIDELLFDLTAPIATAEDDSLSVSDCSDTCSLDSEQRQSTISGGEREARELEEFESFELELQRLHLNATMATSSCGLTQKLEEMEENTLKIIRDCELELHSLDITVEKKLEGKNNEADLPSKAEIARLKILEKILFNTSLRRNKKLFKDSNTGSMDGENSTKDSKPTVS